MDFIAIDFETANFKRNSACSLAVTVVENNQVVDELYSLINPPGPFKPQNIAIHHITPDQVKDAPTFDQLWQVIAQFFTPDHLVIAHNLTFDKSVLKQTLAYYQLPMPQFLTLDTLRTSRHFFPELANHKLNTVCDHLNVELAHHHNALDDSLACANLLLKQRAEFGEAKLAPFIKPA